MTKLTTFATCLAALLLLPSCIANIGSNIRNAAIHHLDVDRGERHRVGPEVLVPEYSYHYRQPIIDSAYWADNYSFTDVRRTGDYRVLLHPEDPTPRALGERRSAGSPGLEAITQPPAGPPSLGPGVSNEKRYSWWYPFAFVAALPFDLVIDPALSIVLSPPYLLLRACGQENILPPPTP